MRLISEHVGTVELIVEEKNGEKHHYIRGPFMQAEVKNRNNRMYPKAILANEAKRYNEEYVTKKRAFGELGHPSGPTINLERVSHMIVSLDESGNDWIGKAKIMDTPYGQIVKNLIDEGANLGVSSRGMGSLKEEKGGVQVVQDDYKLATAADIVADPSAPNAFVQGIMEGKDWVYVDGVLTEREIGHYREHVDSAGWRDKEQAMLDVFSDFFSKLQK